MKSTTLFLFTLGALAAFAACSDPAPGPGGSGGSGADAGTGGSGGSASGSGGGAVDERPTTGVAEPYFIGRFQTGASGSGEAFFGRPAAAAEAVRAEWSGSEIGVRFSGSGLEVQLTSTGEDRFAVVLDGVVQAEKFDPGAANEWQLVVDGLPEGEHHVVLHKLTEPLVGAATFTGARATSGEILPYYTPRERRIEIVGDSITAGYGNEGASAGCAFSADTENHYLTYGAIAARHFDADLTTVAWSGKGMFSNRGSSDTVVMPDLWLETLPSSADSATWTPAAFEPNLVVINLGTNDLSDPRFGSAGDPEAAEAEFLAAYSAFLGALRSAYPSAHVLALVGPMLSDGYPTDRQSLTVAQRVVQGAVDAANAGGDAAVHYGELSTVTSGYGCDYHPGLANHEQAGTELIALIEELGVF